MTLGMNALRNRGRYETNETFVSVDENDFATKQKWLGKYDIRYKLLWFDNGEGLLKITGKVNIEKYRKMTSDDRYLDELCEV